jgi:tol-pal system protein YbgF
MTRALAVVIVAMIATGGCAWRSDVKRLRAEVQQLTESLNRLEAQPAPPTVSSVDALAARLTAANAQINSLERQLRESGANVGRLETRVVEAERATQDATARFEALSVTVKRLDASVPPPPPPPPPAPVVSAPSPVPSPPAVVVVPRPAPTTVAFGPGQIYASALKMFRAREHGQAVLDFLDFLARYPNHALAPSAQYWIAEAYYLQRDYRQALLEFEKVLAYGPSNPRMADALLRAGMASNQVRDSDRAEQHWRRVVEQYPNSDAAQKARGFLSGIGGSRPSR